MSGSPSLSTTATHQHRSIGCGNQAIMIIIIYFIIHTMSRKSLIYRRQPPPISGSCLLWPNGRTDQDATWYTEIGFGPGHIVFAGDPAFPTDNGTTALHFSIHVYCGQTAGWIKMALGTEVGLGPGDIEFRWRPNYPHGKEHNSPQFSVHVYCGQTVAHLSYC